MGSVIIDNKSSLQELDYVKKETITQQKDLLEKYRQKVIRVSQEFFRSGMKGFRPRENGELRTKGLRFSDVRKKKNKLFFSAWHPLANLFQNFKSRKRVLWLNYINRKVKRDG